MGFMEGFYQTPLLYIGTAVAAAAWTVSSYFDHEDSKEDLFSYAEDCDQAQKTVRILRSSSSLSSVKMKRDRSGSYSDEKDSVLLSTKSEAKRGTGQHPGRRGNSHHKRGRSNHAKPANESRYGSEQAVESSRSSQGRNRTWARNGARNRTNSKGNHLGGDSNGVGLARCSCGNSGSTKSSAHGRASCREVGISPERDISSGMICEFCSGLKSASFLGMNRDSDVDLRRKLEGEEKSGGNGALPVVSPNWGFYVSITPEGPQHFSS